jgi:23S rRNA (cytidine1920-2'-O)/16S rRNA (cytidine1409-2'-O)-methyltransferase
MAASRAQALELIGTGGVRVEGLPQPKPSSLVDDASPIVKVAPPPRYVGRGRLKLEHALDRFGIPVAGRRALDAGASTGGFTDCLLQRGAASVTAVDVGYGQLDRRLATDSRVTVCDRTNIRHVTTGDMGGPFDLVVGDLSFISLCTVARTLAGLCTPGADVVLLVKPQFEVGRRNVGKGGVVTDPELHASAVSKVSGCLAEAGLAPQGVVASPITGAKGNKEFLLWATAGGEPRAVTGVQA